MADAAEEITDDGTGADDAGADDSTALNDGATPPGSDTALGDGTPPDPDALLDIPDKFKGEDGKLKEQDILKSYKELEGVLGSQGKPPETADDYKIELEGKFPEGAELNEESHKAFLGRCHEKGMTNDMVQFIMNEYADMVTDVVTEHAETREGTVSQLKEFYGNDYHDKMTSALNAFKAAGLKDVDINDVGNNPAMIKILAVLGENLTEDQLPDNMQSLLGGMSDSELESLMKGPAYFDSKHADHKAVKAKVEAHFKAKHAKRK